MKFSFNIQVLLGAVAGVVIGLVLNASGTTAQPAAGVLYVCDLVGSIFINLLKMIMIPVVFTSILVGIANLRRHAQMGFVWKLTLFYFVATMAVAATLGLLAINWARPGAGLSLPMFTDAVSNFQTESMNLPQFLASFLSHLFVNPFAAMAQGQVLPTIAFAAFLGIALISLGDRALTTLALCNELFELVMTMVGWIMRLLPIGIMGLLAKLIATQDTALLGTLGKFMLVISGITLFHGIVVLPLILFVFTGYSPFRFLNETRDALITAFSTSSSNATLPVSLRCARENLKVDKDIAGFVIPLGATINMDGTAMYEAGAALFVANLAGIDLTIGQQIIVALTAIVAAMGAPGIPSAGMVTMVMVLQSVGLPIEAIAILIPIDKPLDTLRTMVNVEGDLVGSVIVDKYTRRS